VHFFTRILEQFKESSSFHVVQEPPNAIVLRVFYGQA
jgi:hypothetical protein